MNSFINLTRAGTTERSRVQNGSAFNETWKKKKNLNRFDLIFPQMQIGQTKSKLKTSSSRGSSNPQQTSADVKLTTSHFFQVQRRSRGAGRLWNRATDGRKCDT